VCPVYSIKILDRLEHIVLLTLNKVIFKNIIFLFHQSFNDLIDVKEKCLESEINLKS